MQKKDTETKKVNSRILKFRAWDNQLNKFINFPDDVIHVVLMQDGQIRLQKYTEHKQMSQTPEHYGKEIIIQFFTGLTDKNGVEIYEGDIIKMTEGLNVNDWPMSGEIVYNVSSFVMRTFLKGDRVLHISLNLHDGTKFEVIGNIFQNNDLIS